MEYRSDIQLLRGVAVLIVFLFHLQIEGFENGFLGVDVFFVLSGYLMAQLYDKGSARDFYARRINRLLPAYLVTLSAATLLVALVAVPSDADQRFDRFWFDLIGLSNIVYWSETSYFDAAAFRPLLNFWSLGVEFQYYLIVPLLLPFLRRRKHLLYLAIIGSLACAMTMTTLSPKTSFFMMPFRVWEFLLGAFVAWHVGNKQGVAQKIWPSAILLLLLLAVLFIPVNAYARSAITGHPGIAALLTSIITAGVLWRPLHAVFSERNIAGRTFRVLGDYSYSIYLVHFPIIALVNYQAFGGTKLGADGVGDAVIIVAATAISAAALFHFVERSAISSLRPLRISLALLALSVCSYFAGATLSKARFTDDMIAIFEATNDRDEYRCGKIFRLLNPMENVCSLQMAAGERKVLLLGNSHADSIKGAFANAMNDQGVSTYFYVHNEPLMLPRYDAAQILDDLLKHEITDVVFHYAAHFYTRKAHLREIDRLLPMLSRNGVSASVISPVPSYQYIVPAALYEKAVSPETEIEPVSSQMHLERKKAYFDFLDARRDQGLKSYLSYPYLCPEGVCLLEQQGVPLYYDRHHLTLTGARVLSPMFDEIAKDITRPGG